MIRLNVRLNRPSARKIDSKAAAWIAREDRGLTASEETELDRWLAGDSRRLGAYAAAKAVFAHTERARALGPSFDPGSFKAERFNGFEVSLLSSSRLNRRRLVKLGGPAVAASALVANGGWLALNHASRFRTEIGQVRLVPLEDGSVITLNTRSQVLVSFTNQRRDVRLVSGEALFSVAKNRIRPFIVQAGSTRVRAVGTRFTVKCLPGQPVVVVVLDGIVDVSSDVDSGPVTLAANMKATAAGPGAPARVPIVAVNLGSQDIDRQLAWRTGHIAFEGETLREAADEFARYSDTKIVINDPTIGDQQITGLFNATDPVGFAEAAATALELHAEITEGAVTLTERSSKSTNDVAPTSR
jgi:transmembrane sensor